MKETNISLAHTPWFAVTLALILIGGNASWTMGAKITRSKSNHGVRSKPIFKKVNPDGWFSLLVPNTMPAASRFADVDGGSYINKDIEINFNYWAFENKPNYLRNAKDGDDSSVYQSKPWHCLKDEKVGIDKKKARIRICTDDAVKGLRYVYMASFPRLKVYNGQEMMNGTFSLTITYKDARYSRMAEYIVKSINFF
jgi:hypothetical protein